MAGLVPAISLALARQCLLSGWPGQRPGEAGRPGRLQELIDLPARMGELAASKRGSDACDESGGGCRYSHAGSCELRAFAACAGRGPERRRCRTNALSVAPARADPDPSAGAI